ncbi:MAG: HEAT repeat domain-containing protein [Cyanobacteria bacterium P01_A01_bin.68]
MTNNQNQPNKYDAVLGGNSPPPIHGAVLGGIEGVKKRLASSDIDVQISALNDAWNYGDVGLDLVIDALQYDSKKVKKLAYELLENRSEPKVEEFLWRYGFCSERVYETLDDNYIYLTPDEFYNREVINYNSETGTEEVDNNAYVIDEENFNSLFNEAFANNIEALINRGDYHLSFISDSDKFTNLKAVFIGAYELEEYDYWYANPIHNIGLILKAYPKLELLQLRCGEENNDYSSWRYFTKFKHNHLKALILETKGLSRQKVTQISSLKLPALKHLELWLGNDNYDENTSTEYLTPILSGEIFPKLYYLGLRNCEYADEIATAIVNSPVINKIKILDLSLGFLTDAGGTALLNCPAVNNLDILSVANNCLTNSMIDKLMQLDTEVVADNQDIYKTLSNRYEPTWE